MMIFESMLQILPVLSAKYIKNSSLKAIKINN